MQLSDAFTSQCKFGNSGTNSLQVIARITLNLDQNMWNLLMYGLITTETYPKFIWCISIYSTPTLWPIVVLDHIKPALWSLT